MRISWMLDLILGEVRHRMIGLRLGWISYLLGLMVSLGPPTLMHVKRSVIRFMICSMNNMVAAMHRVIGLGIRIYCDIALAGLIEVRIR